MKKRRAVALTLSDGSFYLCIPLWDEEMDDFQKEIIYCFERRGEEVCVSAAGLTICTKLNGVQLERLSDKILRRVLKKRR